MTTTTRNENGTGVAVSLVSTESSVNGNTNDNSNTCSSVTLPTLTSFICSEEQQKQMLDSTLTGAVNDIIFPRKQFIVFEKELAADGKLAKKLLSDLNKDDEGLKGNFFGVWSNSVVRHTGIQPFVPTIRHILLENSVEFWEAPVGLLQYEVTSSVHFCTSRTNLPQNLLGRPT
jgi:hypothetical protein